MPAQVPAPEARTGHQITDRKFKRLPWPSLVDELSTKNLHNVDAKKEIC